MKMPESGDVDQVDYESQHFTYRSIWHAAQVLRDAGERDEAQGFWSLMAATILVHTAYEGFLNDVIERLFPDDWKTERRVTAYRGWLGKTRFLADRLSVSVDRTGRPYCTVAELAAWRNELVHPRTVRLRGTTRADAYARKPRRAKPTAFSKLEKPAFIARCFEDVATLADLLLKAAARQHGEFVVDLGGSAFWGPIGLGGASLRR